MKLIIQIPCYNEADQLPETLAELPREIHGFDEVEWLIIDDGSTDGTAEVARAHGVDHVVSMNGHQGLARGYVAGLDACVARGADVIVNCDADNQYMADDIPILVQPILEGRADLVVGTRPISQISHFSAIKRLLQKLGSSVVRSLSGTTVRDAPSGFRAITRTAAFHLNVFSTYTYTLETLIQAGQSRLRVVNVPIRVNPPTRESRLVRSIPRYVWRSMVTIFSAYVIYRPVRSFFALSMLFLVPGSALALRYVYLALFEGSGAGHVQSVIAAGVLAVIGVLFFAFGITAHLLAINRRLLEEIRFLQRTSDAPFARSEGARAREDADEDAGAGTDAKEGAEKILSP